MKRLFLCFFSILLCQLQGQLIGITSPGGVVDTPTVDIDTGTYLGVKLVTPSCATSGASMYYTTNGTTPTTGSTLYSSGTIATTSTGMTLKILAVKSGMTNSAIKTAVYTTNLISGWKATDGSGTTITDQVAGANFTTSNTTWSGAVSPLTESIVYNGTTSDAVVASASTLNFERTDSFSAVVWMKSTSSSTTNLDQQELLSKLDSTTGYRGWRLQLLYANAGGAVVNTGWQIHLTLYSTFPTNALSGFCTAVPSVNNMHSVGFSYDGTSTNAGLKIYLDGSACTMYYDTNTLSATIAQTASPLHLGTDAYSAANAFQGNLGNIYVYNRVLSAGEFTTMHSTPYTPGI